MTYCLLNSDDGESCNYARSVFQIVIVSYFAVGIVSVGIMLLLVAIKNHRVKKRRNGTKGTIHRVSTPSLESTGSVGYGGNEVKKGDQGNVMVDAKSVNPFTTNY